MFRRTVNNLNKAGRLFVAVCRKCISAPGEAFLLCRMAWWVGVLSATARLRPLPQALELVSGPESRELEIKDTELPNRLARSIDLLLSADFLFIEPICWKRAAVLRRYLSRNGFATRIIFGVRNDTDGQVTGHAWLEANGQPILEKSPPEYIVTYSFPSKQHYEPQSVILTSE
jgi:hypothetical protein